MTTDGKPAPALYWYETPDHTEDWFVVASSVDEAIEFVIEEEGFDEETDIPVEKIIDLPELAEGGAHWPEDETIIAAGGTFVRQETPRVVAINGRTFTEGGMQMLVDRVHDDQAEAAGLGRPNGTKKSDGDS